MGSCIRHCPFHVRVGEIGPEGTTLKPEMAKHNRGVRQIARQQDRYVIAIAGGEHKREAIEAALAKPYFNVLVTDERIARYLLDGR